MLLSDVDMDSHDDTDEGADDAAAVAPSQPAAQTTREVAGSKAPDAAQPKQSPGAKPQQVAPKKPTRAKRIVRGTIATVVYAAIAGGGLGLGLYLQEKYFQANPVYRTPYFVAAAPEKKLGPEVASVIASAKKSVWLACRDVTSKHIAKQLVELSNKGVEVRIVKNRDPSGNDQFMEYLRNAGIREIYVGDPESYLQFAIVDEEIVAHSSAPWSSLKLTGEVLFLRDKALAATYRELFQKRVLESKRS